MALSFYDVQDIALTHAEGRKWLEASVAYDSLARAAREELQSDLAEFYSLNNQSICLLFAGKTKDAIELQERMARILSVKAYEESSDLRFFPEVKECRSNLEIMVAFVKNGGNRPNLTWMPDCGSC
jgi:DNA-binding XRE family transcriptional regulator